MAWEDDVTPLPPGFLFDSSRKNPGSRESENERLRLWEENRALKEEVKGLRIKLSDYALKINELRRRISAASKEKG